MHKIIITLITFLLFISSHIDAKPKPYSPFDLAVINNNKAEVASLLKKGYDINSLTLINKTPLMYAAMVRNVSMVEFLIEKGADVKKRNSNGYTALMFAVGMNDEGIEQITRVSDKYRMASVLLSHGADVTAMDTLVKCSVLHHALKGKTSLQLIKFLADKGASVSAATPGGMTVLMYAAAALNAEILQYLIRKGASVNIKDNNGDTALMYAVDALNNLSLQVVNNKKLFSAYLKTCDILIKNGAHIHITNKKGEYILHRTARIDVPLVKYLVSKGARVNQKDKKGATILKRVEEEYRDGNLKKKQYTDLKQFLIRHGAQEATIRSDQTKYLFGAISAGSLSRVKLYLARGADINGYNANGDTPLLHAIKMINYPIARYLISKGADANGCTKGGTPVLMAVQGIDYTVRNNYRSLNCFTLLLNAGANVNARDAEGRTPAMFAVKTGDMETLRLLSDRKADMTLQDNKGEAVLHYAVRRLSSPENFSLMNFLMAKGARINSQDSKGLTPLAVAISHYHLDVVQYLLEKGANPNIKDIEGKTAIGYSKKLTEKYSHQKKYYDDIILLLKKHGGK